MARRGSLAATPRTRRGRSSALSHVKTWWAGWGASLRLLVFLACTTLVLDDFRIFAKLDALALTLVGQLPMSVSLQPSPAESGHVSVMAVSASTAMFEKPPFDGWLPVDRNALAAMVRALIDLGDEPREQPRVIAIDVDVTPLPGATAECGSPPRCEGPAIHNAIVEALGAGIDVVVSAYPAADGDTDRAVRTQEWRRLLCKRYRAMNPPLKGRLRFASPNLDETSVLRSVVDYERLPKIEKEPVCGESPQTGGLGLTAAGLASTGNSQKDGTHAARPPKAGERRFINFFATQTVLDVNSIEELKNYRRMLNGQVVVLGVKSFEGLDRHITPVGLLTGPEIHAAIARTELTLPIEAQHAKALAIDLGLGLVFIALARGLHFLLHHLAARAGPRSCLLYLVRLSGPLLIFMGLTGVTLLLAQALAIRGTWLNPLIVLLGLTAHLYEHLAAPEAEPAHGAVPKLELRRSPVLTRLDRTLRSTGSIALAIAVLWAAALLLFSNH